MLGVLCAYVGCFFSVDVGVLRGGGGSAVSLEGVHKLFPTFSPAKPRNIFISEQKKPMKLKRSLEGI